MMNKRNVVQGLSTMVVLFAIALVASSVQAQNETQSEDASGANFDAAKLGAESRWGFAGSELG